jgi:hypothetical protein
MCIAANALRQSIEVMIKPQKRCEYFWPIAQLATVFVVTGDLLIELLKQFVPLGIGFAQRREVPGISRLYFGTFRQAKDFGHNDSTGWKQNVGRGL